MPAERGPRPVGPSDDAAATGPLTVSDLLAKSGQPVRRPSGRRVAARQAVVKVRRHRVRRFFAVLLTLLVALLASAAAYYVGLFFYLDRTIDRVDALSVDAPGIMSPEAQEAADNFLIVGTEPVESGVGVASALIAHLTPDRDAAVLVSLPLTALIDVPACQVRGEPTLADPYGGSLASSYDTGGAGCLVRSVQQLSGMRIDHYVEVDLGRLPAMVESLGGVPVCLPAEVVTGLAAQVPVGSSVLDAEQVRAILAQSDADQDPTGALATDRQRLLLASTLREALRIENLANPIALAGFVSEAANGLTLDRATTLGELKDLGDKLGEFTADDTAQTSVPLVQVAYQPVGSEQSYALIDDRASREMFRAIISDSSLPAPEALTDPADPADPADPGETTAQDSTADPSATTEATGSPPPVAPTAAPAPPPAPDPDALTVAPQQITVNVYNGIGTPGLASGAAEQLAAQGFGIGEIENRITGGERSVVRYPPEQYDSARTVAASVPNSVLREGATTGGLIDLVVGSSFSGVVPVVISPPVPTATPVPATTSATATPTGAEPSVAAGRQSCG